MTEEQFQKFMQVNGIDSADEAVQKMLAQLQQSIDPRDFMTPSMREIAEMSMEVLTTEYDQVQQKTSSRSSAQRKTITQRFEYERNAARQTAIEQDPTDA